VLALCVLAAALVSDSAPAGSAPRRCSAPRACTAARACSAPRGCTKKGCADGLTIRLRTRDGKAAPDLVVAVELDGRVVTCRPPAAGQSSSRSCEGGTEAEVVRTRQEVWDCRGGDCRGTGTDEEILEIAARPRRVRVRLSQGERRLGERAFSVRYGAIRPNGARCPPVCRQAIRTWRYR
jgi:hypothetical protein